jgi:hypothetical protein
LLGHAAMQRRENPESFGGLTRVLA